jgi:hypothetical protein
MQRAHCSAPVKTYFAKTGSRGLAGPELARVWLWRATGLRSSGDRGEPVFDLPLLALIAHCDGE